MTEGVRVPPPIPPESRGRRPVTEQSSDDASAYDIDVAGESAQTRAALRAVLASPARARTAVLAAEILGLPRSLKPYGAS